MGYVIDNRIYNFIRGAEVVMTSAFCIKERDYYKKKTFEGL